jgi:hypothetical protein
VSCFGSTRIPTCSHFEQHRDRYRNFLCRNTAMPRRGDRIEPHVRGKSGERHRLSSHDPDLRYFLRSSARRLRKRPRAGLNRGHATPDPGEMERVFLGSGVRKKRWLQGLATPDSYDWLKGHSTVGRIEPLPSESSCQSNSRKREIERRQNFKDLRDWCSTLHTRKESA